MKKLLCGLGLAAVLSSCVGTGLITVFGGNIDFQSNYVLRQGSSDTPVICRNKETGVLLGFNFEGRRENFSSFRVVLTGRTSGNTYPSPVLNVSPDPSAGVSVQGSRVSVEFGFPPNTVPFSFGARPQAVTVTPIPTTATRIGTLDLTLSITDSSGTTATSNVLVPGIPVYDNCQ